MTSVARRTASATAGVTTFTSCAVGMRPARCSAAGPLVLRDQSGPSVIKEFMHDRVTQHTAVYTIRGLLLLWSNGKAEFTELLI